MNKRHVSVYTHMPFMEWRLLLPILIILLKKTILVKLFIEFYYFTKNAKKSIIKLEKVLEKSKM